MIIKKEDYVMDVDIEQTKGYYTSNLLCDCPSCRNYYTQVKNNFRLLNHFLLELGVDIARPDELCGVESDNKIKYLFATYTVFGKILEFDQYEIDLFEDSGDVSLVINNFCDSGEQKTSCFVITVYNVALPWVLNESFKSCSNKKHR